MSKSESATQGRDAAQQSLLRQQTPGNGESLGQLLAALPTEQRRTSFSGLLISELRARRQRGEKPQEQDYLDRLPEFADLISAVFQAQRDSQSIAGAPTVGMSVDERRKPSTNRDSDDIDETEDSNAPSSIGRYKLLSIVGRGGFAHVWKAHDPTLDRVVAVKVLRPDRVGSAEADRLMLAEARRLANLSLPGLVPVYDVVEEQGKSFIVSKFVTGGNLAARLRTHSFRPVEAALLVAQVAETLHQAHLQDIVHRDVKPANILLDDRGFPLVADFGLAASETEQRHEQRHVLGTYKYMSPEQARGEGHLADARTDIYSLGMVLYELLTGRVAFLGEYEEELVEQILDRPPRPPRTIDDSLPAELERICLKCLEKERTARYLTAADLAADLRRWLRLQDGVTTATGRRWQRVSLVGFSAVMLALAAVTIWALNGPLGQSPGTGANVTPAASPEAPPAATPEPTPLEQEYKLWEKRFGSRPHELHWPGYRDLSTIGYRDEVRAVEVTSRSTRLLSLGNLDGNQYSISVGLGQSIWLGGCGIFYDYHEVIVDGQPEAHFESIFLAAVDNASGERTLRVRRNSNRISPRDGTIYPRRELGEQVVPWPPTDVLSRLEMQVDGDRISALRWAGAELPDIAKKKLPSPKLGVWGLLHANGTSWFQDPRCAGFQAPPEARTP